jgi:hypothetical protein
MTTVTLFDPAIAKLTPGAKIAVKSQLTAANGSWTLVRVGLTLASQTPNGPWEMSLEGTPRGSR